MRCGGGKWSWHLPFAARVVLGFALGALLGCAAGPGRAVAGLTTDDLGMLGLLVIRMLKALAVFLVLFASLDALINTDVPARSAFKLMAICAVNACVALTIGLTLLNLIKPGKQWEGQIGSLLQGLAVSTTTAPTGAKKADLSPLHNIQGFIPESLVDPFASNNIVSVIILTLLLGMAFRTRRSHAQRVLQEAAADAEAPNPEAAEDARSTLGQLQQLGQVVTALSQVMAGAVELVVALVPFAVFGVVAMSVAKTGLYMFVTLAHYLWVVILGMILHALVYYPTVAWLFARRSPRELWHHCRDAVVMGMSTNSSLATLPVTLRCLKQLGVSDANARLSACIGTNLNNDGITLYEAMAALFLAQACGFDLSLGKQLVVVFASIMAGVGIAGVPEAGMVVLPLVLGAAGLPEQAVAAALPLLLPVDWIVGRFRSLVNVMSDMLVAMLLDAWDQRLGHCGGCGRGSAVKEEAPAIAPNTDEDPHRQDSQEPESEHSEVVRTVVGVAAPAREVTAV